jgi:D-serine deaminase-like pyridoxal phosphate-dependent protein
MNIKDCITPCWLLEEDKLRHNIVTWQQRADSHGKELWPMIKTHKSSAIARRQKEAGAAGFLTGTLREAEVLLEQGLGPIMHAYPVAGEPNLERALALAEKGRILFSLDGEANSRQLSEAWRRRTGTPELEVMLIIDSGLHRLGVQPELAGALGQLIHSLPGLRLVGVATHPGAVYGATGPAQLEPMARATDDILQRARAGIEKRGIALRYVASGSTPSFEGEMASPVINVVRPGNYVYFDQTQMAVMGIPAASCALTVLATVIAQPSADRLIIDAGSKALSTDLGAHTTGALSDYGYILEQPGLKLVKVSEEISKIQVGPQGTEVRVGDQLRIIPNHTCPVNNLADRLTLVRGSRVTGHIAIDMKTMS